ncbi:MAG: ribosome maturation factor RimP [Candidatus Omnitrophica bacterium]|nr:ribosome maturation factor RimP [Candidatus Omnitrophota bacterium]
MSHPLEGSLVEIIKPLVEGADAELVQLSCRPSGGRLHLEILVDRTGGINLDVCADLNRKIGDVLEASGTLDQAYVLEVSSPGLDRPLSSDRDFEKALGSVLEIFSDTPGVSGVTGTLQVVEADSIQLGLESGEVIRIKRSDIGKARRKITF